MQRDLSTGLSVRAEVTGFGDPDTGVHSAACKVLGRFHTLFNEVVDRHHGSVFSF